MSPRDDNESESDVEDDDHVAASRAGKTGDDGTYVGQTASDDALDVGQSGAEARSEQGGR
jgi:hypothetical protein